MSIVEAWELLSKTWPTVALSVVLGLGGGVIGAAIGAWSQRKLAQSGLREEARRALRAYERVLLDLGNKQQSEFLDDGAFDFTAATWEALAESRAAAYLFADQFSPELAELLRRGWVEDTWPHEDPLTTSNSLLDLGTKIRASVDKEFPAKS